MIKLLVVDDEKGIIDTLANFFKYRGFSVRSAETGIRALELIRCEKPNIVFLDIQLPGISGLKLLEEVKKIDPSIKVIMLTATAEQDVIDAAMAFGADEYILKPFSLDRLDAIVIKNVQEIYNGENYEQTYSVDS